MRPAPRVLLATLALATIAACGGRSSRRANDNFPPVTVHVMNQNFNDVTVYFVWGGGDRRRLGVVNGHGQATFTARWQAPTVQVEVDVLAGSRYRGERFTANPGDEFIIEIPSALERFRVYRR